MPGAANLALHTASKVLIMQVLRTGVKTRRDIFAHQKPPIPLCCFVDDTPNHEPAKFLQACNSARAHRSHVEDVDLSPMLGLPDIDNFESESESEL